MVVEGTVGATSFLDVVTTLVFWMVPVQVRIESTPVLVGAGAELETTTELAYWAARFNLMISSLSLWSLSGDPT